MKPITIRTATLADLDTIAAVEAECFPRGSCLTGIVFRTAFFLCFPLLADV